MARMKLSNGAWKWLMSVLVLYGLVLWAAELPALIHITRTGVMDYSLERRQ